MAVMKLTQEGISKLRCPDDKRSVQICDAQHRGLLLELRRTDPDHPTWYVRYKDPSKRTKYVRLGHFPSMSLADARASAKDVQASIRLGADPRAEEDAKKAVPFFSDYMVQTYLPYVRTHLRTAGKLEEYYRLRLKNTFGHKRLNQIRHRDIQLFHSKLREEGLAPASCNLYLRTLKTAMSKAILWQIMDPPNPAVGIRQYRERQVENYMDEAQLSRLLAVLQSDKNRMVCNIILFLLSTGARLNEALQARWEHIDIEHRVWRVPATNSKSGKVRAVPLNDSAIDVLNDVDTKNKSEWVFPSKRNHGQPFVSLQKVWDRLRRQAGPDLCHIRIHDLRHQHASMLVNNGRTLYEVQQILGHSTSKVTERYSHLSTTTLQSASSCAADVIKEAMKKSA